MSRVILDFPAPPPAAGAEPGAAVRQIFAAPRRIITAASLAQVRPALREVEASVAAGAWAVGFVAYEAAPAFDAALITRPAHGPTPLLWFGIFDAPAVAAPPAHGAPPALRWSTATPRGAYDAAIHEIRQRIAAGDVYQVNHTLRFHADCESDALPLYDALVAPRHGLYHALIETDEWAVISASPELFLDLRDELCDELHDDLHDELRGDLHDELRGDLRGDLHDDLRGARRERRLTTRPMKGTLRRGRWLAEDRTAAARLAASAKDRAENLMIVDLLRNDVGRVARFGSVNVPRMYDVETYPTVHQLTSTVTAVLRDGTSLDDVFAAMFPCGSVTGAPKVAAMRIIARLEDEPRGPYCGAVGVVRPDGSATFSVAIRTLLLDRVQRRAVYGAGGGITWDSRAAAEYDELIAKAALLSDALPPFDLLETMRCDDGVVQRLELHLRRLDESAAYWRFADGTAGSARAALEDFARRMRRGHWRVRLTAARDGAIRITHTPLDTAAIAIDENVPALPVALALRAVSRLDRMLCHKTTARQSYDARRAVQPDAFDVLLFNDEGEVTEFTLGNVVAQLDGRLLTPPRACGLLAGTLRQQLLDEGVIEEAVLTIAQVRRATRLWHINSVRGWTPVLLQPHASPSTSSTPAAVIRSVPAR
jgi:para-aminobenzoate synthetase / 4-amino-4-deoxychorismate lyase